MAFGPGKYDNLASLVRRKAMASDVLLVVIGGTKGMGFSVQSTAVNAEQRAGKMRVLAAALRQVADEMDRDARRVAVMSDDDLRAAEAAEAHPKAATDDDLS